MAVKMRLMRMGKKKHPIYRVVVVDGRAPRDGRYIEQIGRYAPLEDPSMVEIDNEKAAAWLSKGAQPTEAVEKLLNISGAMNTMKVRTGQIHTVGGAAPVVAAPEEKAVVEDEVVVEDESAPETVGDEAATDEVVAAPEEKAVVEDEVVVEGESAPEETVGDEAATDDVVAAPEAAEETSEVAHDESAIATSAADTDEEE